jgi:RNA polymerase sigma factor (sigma-70 family)
MGAGATVAKRLIDHARRECGGADGRLERAFVNRIVDRDLAALEETYARYGRPVWSLARKVVGDDGTAEEIVQGAFLRFWRRASDYDPACRRLLLWLFTIAHHRAVDELRRRRARGELDGLNTAIVTIKDPNAGPAGIAVAHVDREAVGAALAALPDAQQRAIELACLGATRNPRSPRASTNRLAPSKRACASLSARDATYWPTAVPPAPIFPTRRHQSPDREE